MSRLSYGLSLALLYVACGDDSDPSVVANAPVHRVDAAVDATSTGPADAQLAMSPPDASSSLASGCSDQARWIYLVDRNDAFLRYEPDSGKITQVGKLTCSTTAHPFSMAVSRGALAYVLYNDGNIYEVSTSDASCKPTSYTSSDPAFKTFGMGFASDAEGSTQEKLYIVGFTGDAFDAAGQSSLASLDTQSWNLTRRGALKGAAELTGNGKGELWAYFVASPMVVRQLDKSSGATLREISVASVDTSVLALPQAWAFAFWGGVYYLFYQSAFGTSTSIYRLNPMTEKVELVKGDIGFGIVGAGVSTCAPVVLL